MAKAKVTSEGEILSLEQLIEYFNGQGVLALKVNDFTIKLPYAWGTEIELSATEFIILNAYHAPLKIKALA